MTVQRSTRILSLSPLAFVSYVPKWRFSEAVITCLYRLSHHGGAMREERYSVPVITLLYRLSQYGVAKRHTYSDAVVTVTAPSVTNMVAQCQ